ncbi:hypothetical protein YT1_p10063 (plasmid) [Rhodococcus ruber]|nr:hypothetical protein YT1_p10063 [Rhodococcus ruber]
MSMVPASVEQPAYRAVPEKIEVVDAIGTGEHSCGNTGGHGTCVSPGEHSADA